MRIWNFRGEQNRISEALRADIPGHAVISVTGAGGKTSLIFAWAHELAAAGKRVAVTTTTHMFSPDRMKQDGFCLYDGVTAIPVLRDFSESTIPDTKQIGTSLSECTNSDPDALPQVISEISDTLPESGGIIFVFSPDPDNHSKVCSPGKEILEYLYRTADVTLVEADGSRRMPLKWPAPWEPVVPDITDITVCVAGLSALGRDPSDVIYRAEHLPEGLRRSKVDINLINGILISNEGGQKGSRGEHRIFLNQADDDELQADAAKLQKMLAVCGLQSAWGTLLPKQAGVPASEQAGVPASDQAGMPAPEQAEAKRPDKTGLRDACDAERPRIAVILEAAGNSTRFGSNKLLHIMENGRPMIAAILDSVRPLDTYKKILVTQYDEAAALAADFDIVINDRPELGISRSMQLGIEAAGDADAYMFCVCDQPGLSTSTLQKLIDAFTDAHKKGIAVIASLSWQGKMCNPKIFSSELRDELMNLSGDTGGRQIIAAHTADLLLVEALCEAEVTDIDRPE